MYLLFTVVLSAALVFCVVYPLWYFATTCSFLYSVILITLALILFLYFIIRKTVRNYKSISDDAGKKRYSLKLVFTLLSILAALLALILFVSYVLSENRITAFILLIAGLVLSVVMAMRRKNYSDA